MGEGLWDFSQEQLDAVHPDMWKFLVLVDAVKKPVGDMEPHEVYLCAQFVAGHLETWEKRGNTEPLTLDLPRVADL